MENFQSSSFPSSQFPYLTSPLSHESTKKQYPGYISVLFTLQDIFVDSHIKSTWGVISIEIMSCNDKSI